MGRRAALRHHFLDDLFARARAGDRDTAALLIDWNRRTLLRVIRRRLKPDVAAAVDSADVLQETSMAILNQDFAIVFASPTVFLTYCTRAARNKAANTNRDFRARTKYQPPRLVPLHAIPSCEQPVDPAPPPAELAVFKEGYAAFLASLHWPDNLILLALELGYSVSEIALDVGMMDHQLRYRVGLIRKRFLAWSARV